MFRNPQRVRVSFSAGTEQVTKQEFKDECDINNILSQFRRTGIISHIMRQEPVYGELPEVGDFQASLALIDASEEAFSALPAAVRRFFDNDPARLLSALQDPSMRSQLEQLGVLRGPESPQPAGNPENRNPSVAPSLGTAPALPVSARPAAPSGSPSASETSA